MQCFSNLFYPKHVFKKHFAGVMGSHKPCSNILPQSIASSQYVLNLHPLTRNYKVETRIHKLFLLFALLKDN